MLNPSNAFHFKLQAYLLDEDLEPACLTEVHVDECLLGE